MRKAFTSSIEENIQKERLPKNALDKFLAFLEK